MDCPRPWGGLSAVQNFEPTNLQTSLTKTGSYRRTVRSPGAASVEIEHLRDSLRAVEVARDAAEEEVRAARDAAVDAQARAFGEFYS